MTVSNPPQSRGHVEAGGDGNSPPAQPRREESPQSSQQTEAGGETSAPTTSTTSEAAGSEAPEANNEGVVEGMHNFCHFQRKGHKLFN